MVSYITSIVKVTPNKFKKVCDIADNISLEELRDEYLKRNELIRCSDCGAKLQEFLERYKIRDDLTIKYYEDDMTIHQCASGGYDCRDIKEGLRRAFHQIIKRKASKKGIKVRLTVW